MPIGDTPFSGIAAYNQISVLKGTQFPIKLSMDDASALKLHIAREMEQLTDSRVTSHIRSLLVEPTPVLLNWQYGEPGQQYPGWIVLRHGASETDIVHCEYGFGPQCPWGLVWSANEERKEIWMGQDSGWHSTFLDGYFESKAVTDLPIWRAFKRDPSGGRQPLTDEGTWRETWALVEKYRQSDPISIYDCHQSIYD